MNASFKLSEKLRLFLLVGSRYQSGSLGVEYPVSIRRRYSWSQSIVIYPDADYNFFTSREVIRILSLANGLDLNSSLDAENGLPVITISDYSINNK